MINTDKINIVLQAENGLVLLACFAITALVYKFFLRDTSQSRHELLNKQLKNLTWFALCLAALSGFYYLCPSPKDNNLVLYLSLLIIGLGAIAVVKLFRFSVFEYFFIVQKKVAVPLLLINLFTIVFSITAAIWVIGYIFSINFAPLVATSAVLSIVLGLALQDTLGNLFCGIALQFDKSYRIGDWVEVINGSQRIVGQIQEISWRATTLVSFTDESITVPNRLMAQSQISNFSGRTGPLLRSQVFRIPYGTDIEKSKALLLESLKDIPDILNQPAPLALFSEAHESWMTLKSVYYLKDFGRQFIVADAVIDRTVRALAAHGIHIASNRIDVQSTQNGRKENA